MAHMEHMTEHDAREGAEYLTEHTGALWEAMNLGAELWCLVLRHDDSDLFVVLDTCASVDFSQAVVYRWEDWAETDTPPHAVCFRVLPFVPNCPEELLALAFLGLGLLDGCVGRSQVAPGGVV